MIKNKTIDSNYFEIEIRDYIKANNITREDIICITDDGLFNTLWYWVN